MQGVATDPSTGDRQLVAIVQHVERGDRRAVAGALADAFSDDALSRWIYRDHPRRLQWIEADFRLRLDQHGPDRLSYTTDDHAGAAVWAAPGRWRGHPVSHPSVLGALWRLARNRRRVRAVQEQLDRRHPQLPHLYLALLGVRPALRGRGFGGALLAPALAHADAHAIPAYVEAGSDRAAHFYAGLGFAPRGEVRVSGAPVIHLMWREPALAARPRSGPA